MTTCLPVVSEQGGGSVTFSMGCRMARSITSSFTDLVSDINRLYSTFPGGGVPPRLLHSKRASLRPSRHLAIARSWWRRRFKVGLEEFDAYRRVSPTNWHCGVQRKSTVRTLPWRA